MEQATARPPYQCSNQLRLGLHHPPAEFEANTPESTYHRNLSHGTLAETAESSYEKLPGRGDIHKQADEVSVTLMSQLVP